MKLKALGFLFFTQITLSFAQIGQNTVSIGAGFPNLPKFFFSYLNTEKNYSAMGTGPFHLKYENRVKPWLGVGLSINHMTYSISYSQDVLDTNLGRVYPNKINISSNNTAFNARANIHFLNPEKKNDLYLGLGIGIRTGKLIIDSEFKAYQPKLDLPSLSRLGMEMTLGYRHFFDDNLGIYAELGLAKSIFQFGFAGKF
jgi:hypothetical protein